MVLTFATLLLIFGSIATLIYVFLPIVSQGVVRTTQKQAQKNVSRADIYLQDEESQKAYRLTVLLPIILGVCGLIFAPDALRLAGMVVGVIIGIIIPRMYVTNLINTRKKKFNDQLINALMIMSSSFRGGLSLIQAIESVVEEMPDPIRREFGIVLGENKMGVSLDEGLNRLYTRMPSIALQHMITAILLARETGGNLPVIFSRIVGTLRERKKIEQNLNMLTVQGKIQAVVMTLLPVLFVLGISATNPRFFNVMFSIEQGRQMLMVAVFLWVVGAFFIWKISKFKDF